MDSIATMSHKGETRADIGETMADIDQAEEERNMYHRINWLLYRVYDKKTLQNTLPKDKYGNICYNRDRVAYRTAVENVLCTDVLDYVKRKDSRFSGIVHGVGSCFAGVSVTSNEADLLFMIDIEGSLEDCTELPGYAKYCLSGCSLKLWKDCTTCDGYLMSQKVAGLFYNYVEEALGSDLRKKFRGNDGTPEVVLTGIGTIATTVTVTYNISTIIDIDLVVAVSCKGLPPLATASWLKSKSSWPNAESVAKIRASGFQLVSKAPYPQSQDEGTTLWRISFSLAETMLLQDLDANIIEHGLCTKICFVLMKFYRMCELATLERDVTPVLKSYYLKVVLLFECHEFPETAAWESDKLAERFLSMFRRLYEMIEQQRIQEFFMPSVNVMTSRVGLRKELRFLLDKPEEALEAWEKNTENNLKLSILL